MSAAAPIDPATRRLLAGELAKSLWATAKPQAGGGDEDGASGMTSGVETFSSLFTDILADAIAADATTTPKTPARP